MTMTMKMMTKRRHRRRLLLRRCQHNQLLFQLRKGLQCHLDCHSIMVSCLSSLPNFDISRISSSGLGVAESRAPSLTPAYHRSVVSGISSVHLFALL
mmetsp:Transcript_36772/g.95225  ORF Transcript_36772/g.95225 Transcript_36772/m.95225 type:complete len:97 (-) Transcript_36772:473-763(-)